MVVFVAFLAFLGYGFDRFYLGGGSAPFPIGSVFALGIVSVSALSSYYAGDRAVLLSTGAIPTERAIAAASEEDRLKLRQCSKVEAQLGLRK